MERSVGKGYWGRYKGKGDQLISRSGRGYQGIGGNGKGRRKKEIS